MKRFLEGLLIFFALGLCALIAVQWVREVRLVAERQQFADQAHASEEARQQVQASLKRVEADLARLTDLNHELSATNKLMQEERGHVREQMDKAAGELERSLQQVEVYKEALERANQNVKKQNESITRQNEEMKQLAEERNEGVQKFNDLAKQYNEVVAKWNKLQDDLAKAEAQKNPAKK